MKSMKRMCALALASVIVITGLTGCNKTSKEVLGENGKMKLSMASWITGPVKANSEIEKKLEEKFPDVDFEFVALERETWQQQLNTRVAGGDIPDIIYRDHQYFIVEYVKQDLLAEIPFTMVKEFAPDILEATKSYGESVWLACNVDGKNYGLPIMQPNQSYPSVNSWRMDWLKNVGITKMPETIEEYEDAFRKFVNNDPDKNGVKDTYGLTYNGKSAANTLFRPIFTAYNAVNGAWMKDENGELIYGSVAPGAKEALKTLNRWYQEGLIDPEFITTDTALVKQKWINGKIGYMPGGTWYRMVPGGEHYEGLKAVNPNAQISTCPAPIGPSGSFGYGTPPEGEEGAITSSISFSKKLQDNPEKLKKAISVVNQMMTDKELYGMLKYGVENVNWKRDEKNGIKLIEPFNLPENCGELGTNFFASFFATPEIQKYYSRDDIEDQYKYAKAGNVHQLENWVGYFVPQDVKKVADNAELVADKWIINFIIGKEPIDKFDQYVKEWYEAGGQQATEAYKEAYKIGQSKMQELYKKLD